MAASAGTRRSTVTLCLVAPEILLGVEDVGADGAFVLALRLSFAERLARLWPYRAGVTAGLLDAGGHRRFSKRGSSQFSHGVLLTEA